MRILALAAITALGLGVAGTAAARVWTDPAGRILFDAPSNWATTQERGAGPSDTFTYVISGTAQHECHFIGQASPSLASANADQVRTTGADAENFDAAFWTTTANGIPSVFPNDSASVLSTSIDTSGFWPIARAEIQSPERLVHAAMQIRPGHNLTALCMTYGGAEPTDGYDGVIRSVGHPNDAAFRAEAERIEAERAAAAAAAAAAPPAEEDSGRRRRRN